MSRPPLHLGLTLAPVVVGMAIGKYRIDHETGSDLVHLCCSGVWSLNDAKGFAREMEPLLARARRSLGGAGLKVMADNSRVAVQTQNVIDEISAYFLRAHTAEDRIAIVVGSNLAKLQMRRSLTGANTEFFLSPRAAMAWLVAQDACEP